MRWAGVFVFAGVAACAGGGAAKPALVPAPEPVVEPAPDPTPPAAVSEPLKASNVMAGEESDEPVVVKRCPLAKKCPAVKIDKLASITLERTECRGECPVYTVTLRADGFVKWNGVEHVAHTGEETKNVAPILAKAVLEYAATSCFYGMKAEYEYVVTDSSHAITTMVASGKKKSVRRHVVPNRILAGQSACAPPEALESLESKIDEVAGTRELIGETKRKAAPHAKP